MTILVIRDLVFPRVSARINKDSGVGAHSHLPLI